MVEPHSGQRGCSPRPGVADRAIPGRQGLGARRTLGHHGDDYSGMTSPARRTTTVSPTRMPPLLGDFALVVEVALVTVTPPTKTGF